MTKTVWSRRSCREHPPTLGVGHLTCALIQRIKVLDPSTVKNDGGPNSSAGESSAETAAFDGLRDRAPATFDRRRVLASTARTLSFPACKALHTLIRRRAHTTRAAGVDVSGGNSQAHLEDSSRAIYKHGRGKNSGSRPAAETTPHRGN